MTALPILYSFRRCPYAMRARMAVAVSGVSVELREVVLRDKPPELVEASAKATVPVLVLPNGCVIEESLDIMRWALQQNDPENWLAAENLDIIQRNDGPFKTALDRYKYPHRYGLDHGTRYRDDGLSILAELEAKLGNNPVLRGNIRGMTDIAILPFVRQFAATDRHWFEAQPFPNLHRWLGELLGSDLFGSIMHRYPQWRAGNAGTVFP